MKFNVSEVLFCTPDNDISLVVALKRKKQKHIHISVIS